MCALYTYIYIHIIYIYIIYIYIYNIHIDICITFPAIIEYGIKILASPGIPGIELENRYLEYS